MTDRQVYLTATAIMAAVIIFALVTAGASVFTHLP